MLNNLQIYLHKQNLMLPMPHNLLLKPLDSHCRLHKDLVDHWPKPKQQLKPLRMLKTELRPVLKAHKMPLTERSLLWEVHNRPTHRLRWVQQTQKLLRIVQDNPLKALLAHSKLLKLQSNAQRMHKTALTLLHKMLHKQRLKHYRTKRVLPTH